MNSPAYIEIRPRQQKLSDNLTWAGRWTVYALCALVYGAIAWTLH